MVRMGVVQIRDEQDAKTLKALGEQLPKFVKPLLDKYLGKYPEANIATILIYVIDDISKSLKQGKFPE